MSAAMCSTGLGAPGEARRRQGAPTIAGLRSFTEDAESIAACPPVFQVRGHKRAIEH